MVYDVMFVVAISTGTKIVLELVSAATLLAELTGMVFRSSIAASTYSALAS